MNRKALAAIGAAAALSLTLAACGSSSGDAPEDEATESGPVELSVAVWSLDQTPEFQALFDAFETANPDITIKPVDILADDYPEKVTTMLAGGDTTDVLTMKNLTDYSRFAGRGQLEDVTDLVTDYPDGKLAGTDGYDQDGKYFAVPYRQDFWVLYYNKSLFDAAGVDYPDARDVGRLRRPRAEADRAPTRPGRRSTARTSTSGARSCRPSAQAQTEGADLLSGDYEFLKDQYDHNVGLQKDGDPLDYSARPRPSRSPTGRCSRRRTPRCCRWAPGTSPGSCRPRRTPRPRRVGHRADAAGRRRRPDHAPSATRPRSR